ncbi:glycosyltransferase family A protein, partial [Verrucomicrobiota bacterium]
FYNEERFIAEAVESILAQNDPNLEILAVNDGSTDNSAQIVKGHGAKVQLIEQDNQGTSSALNHGIRRAEGEFLAFLDADDVWVDDKLAWQRREMRNNPELDVVLGQMQNFLSPDLPDSEKERLSCPQKPIVGNCPGTMLIRRDSFEKVGSFSSKWRVGEYLDWFIRARERHLKFAITPRVMMKRRIHRRNKGRLLPEAKIDYLSIIKESLDRRRNR